MKQSISKAEGDIARLIGLGFLDWQKDLNGVRVIQDNHKKNVEEISYPHSSYSGNCLTRDDFWSKHRAKVILDALKGVDQELIWEVGGGDGRVGLQLAEKGIGLVFVEPLYEGCAKIAKEGLPVYQGTLQDLQLPDNSLSALGLFDVLEHIEDDRAFLGYLFSKLEKQGKLFLTVPAHPWLFSQHDVALGHFRRYSSKALIQLLEESGFNVVRADFLYSVLVPVAFAWRRIPYFFIKHSGVNAELRHLERALNVPPLIGKLLSSVLKIEKKAGLPFGLSFFAVAEKGVNRNIKSGG